MIEEKQPPFQTLTRPFFKRKAEIVAKDLLGRLLLHDENKLGLCGGIIVETEAYDQSDPASHSCTGQTRRNQMMFGESARAYIYRSYGIHWCFNVTVGPAGHGAAVLIRAIEPLLGLNQMKNRRNLTLKNCPIRNLARGPGRLCQALRISDSYNGLDLLTPPLFIATPQGFKRPQSVSTPRIGITKAIRVPWRFCIVNNKFVSGKTV